MSDKPARKQLKEVGMKKVHGAALVAILLAQVVEGSAQAGFMMEDLPRPVQSRQAAKTGVAFKRPAQIFNYGDPPTLTSSFVWGSRIRQWLLAR